MIIRTLQHLTLQGERSRSNLLAVSMQNYNEYHIGTQQLESIKTRDSISLDQSNLMS
jgi:hypothetical protein